MSELVFSVLRIGAAVYAGLCLLLLFRQSGYVYYPDREVGLTPSYFNIPYEDVALKTGDGETIAGWFIPVDRNTNEPAPTVLFCHGNGGDIGDWLDSVKTFYDMGLNALIFDYRGYGDSSGKPTEEGTYQDALAAWLYLTGRKGIPEKKIIVFGRSLGGSVATWLAEKVSPGALVIASTFTSAPDMAAKMFPFLPARLLCRFRYDSLSRIGNVRCPVLIAHSKDDEMIPYEHGRRLFEKANEPKQFVEMTGGHNSGGLDADPSYQEILKTFILNSVVH